MRRAGRDGRPGTVDERSCRTLYLPVDKTVEIELKSRDVIHSFWVVDFLYKKDMIPARQLHVLHADERGHLRRQVRRALRRVPLRTCCSA